MAINDKENPEEGTPRSNKDIRRERRQMKSINKQRQAMGGDVLYKAEDFEEIKKPYQGGPGETSIAVSAEETKPDIEYIKYDAAGPGQKPKEVRATFKAGTTEAEQIRKDSEAGQRIIKTLAANPNTATTTENVIQTKAAGDNTLTSSQVDDMNKASLVVGNKVQEENQKINEATLDAKNTSSNIGDLTQMPPGTPDDWVNTYVTEGFEPEDKNSIIERAAAAAKKRAPQLAIEKLGVQDYYPEIGRDIAVGTFTGSRIGSQTIYSGAGGLLPLGLYDARKRAIAADIKKKESLMDQLKEMPDIAKQYKPAFAQNFYEGLMNYVDAYKDNPEGLASDPGYLKFMSTQKGVAENFSKTSAYLSDLEEKLVDPKTGSPAAWVTPGMLKIINNVKTGMVPGKVEDYFSGKKNIAKVLNTVRALPDALKQADDIIETLISKGGVETAINLKTGKEFTEKDIADLNSLVQQIKSPSVDYEMFAELRKKYFDFEYDVMAKEWVEMHMADQPQNVKDEVQKSMSSYIESQMPDDAIISTITSKANNYTTRRGQDLDLLKSRERMAFEAEQNKLDRESSPTKLDIEEMLEKGERVRTVNTPETRMGTQSSDELIYNVYDPVQGKFRQVTGASIRRDQKQGYQYYDRTGKNLFKLPEGNPQYEQGSVTYYNNNGNVKAISKGTAYTTSYNRDTQKIEYNAINVDVSLPATNMTTTPNKVDNSRAVQYDIPRGVNVSDAAKKTGGTGSYVTGSGSSRRY